MKVELAVGFLHGRWESCWVKCKAEEWAVHEHDEPFWLRKMLSELGQAPRGAVSFVKVIHTEEID